MPCQSDGYDYSAEADAATRAACELVKTARGMGSQVWGKMAQKLSKRTLAWIEDHDEADKQREREEKEEAAQRSLKSKALKKLSRKEREALGVR
jgi:hypothetical protein